MEPKEKENERKTFKGKFRYNYNTHKLEAQIFFADSSKNLI
jgi:hypothetical protein